RRVGERGQHQGLHGEDGDRRCPGRWGVVGPRSVRCHREVSHMSHKLILLRHGQSVWNLENLFTGWTDVGLTEAGEEEARTAGRLMAAEGLKPDVLFTSVLRRATE